MPSIPLHPRPRSPCKQTASNPLPQLLQTPSGLALLELQGTINFPSSNEDHQQQHHQQPHDANEPPSSTTNNNPAAPEPTTFETPLGKLLFPDYSPQTTSADDTSWMKRVYLYVGKYQRMTGEVKKLGKPVAVVQRRQNQDNTSSGDELEILDVMRYKVIFTNRPEPVNDS